MDTFERRLRLIVLDKVVLDTSDVSFRENSLPIHNPFADFGHVAIFIEIFDMNQRKASGIFLEVCENIGAGFVRPTKVHLHLDQLGIALGKQNVVRQLAILRLKFFNMVVISKLNACLVAFFAGAIEGLETA